MATFDAKFVYYFSGEVLKIVDAGTLLATYIAVLGGAVVVFKKRK